MEHDWKMTRVLDKLGVPIEVGSCVIYGHAMGRSAGLRVGKVLSVGVEEVKYGERTCSIRVRGIDDDWNCPGLTKCKPGTLRFSKRILVIPSESLPEEFRKVWEEL